MWDKCEETNKHGTGTCLTSVQGAGEGEREGLCWKAFVLAPICIPLILNGNEVALRFKAFYFYPAIECEKTALA